MNVSFPGLWTALERRLPKPFEMYSRRYRTRAFPVSMMLTPQQLPSVYHNPSCGGCARDAEENRIRKKILVDKT